MSDGLVSDSLCLGAMTPARPLQYMTYAEYLAFEQTSQQKHEFIAGEVFAMAGGTLEHSAIALDVDRIYADRIYADPLRHGSARAQ